MHSCNIKTLIKSAINMLVSFCFTPDADDREGTSFSLLCFCLYFLNPPLVGFFFFLAYSKFWYMLSSHNDCDGCDVWLPVLFVDYLKWHLHTAAAPCDLGWETCVLVFLATWIAMKVCTETFCECRWLLGYRHSCSLKLIDFVHHNYKLESAAG